MGLLGSVFSTVGNVISQDSINKQQMQHDRNMAGLSQQYNVENMARQQQYNRENMEIQNQYQLDQWNRENAYNDPSAVRARYEAAGLSPQAAFGAGSASGAGISGSFSSAPSGGQPSGSSVSPSASQLRAPNITFDTGGLNQIVHTAELRRMQQEKQNAEILKLYEETKSQKLANEKAEYEKANGKWDAEIKSEKGKAKFEEANAVMAEIRSLSYDLENKLNLENKSAVNDELRAKVNHYNALVDQIEELTPDMKRELRGRTSKYYSDIKLNEENVKVANDLAKLYQVQGTKAHNEAMLLQMDALFRSATQGLPLEVWSKPAGVASALVHALGGTNNDVYTQILPKFRSDAKFTFDLLKRYAPPQVRKKMEVNSKKYINDIEKAQKSGNFLLE